MESGIQNNNSHRNHEKDDKEFAFLLNRHRTHEKGQPFFLERFLERFIYTVICFYFTNTRGSKICFTHFPNKEVNVQNEHMIKQVCFQVNISRATDFYKNAVNGEIAQRDEPYSTFASEDLLDILELGIGARAMLVRNINTEDG